jgi:protocatechuate 3,4-dioxygenase, alpha subunit
MSSQKPANALENGLTPTASQTIGPFFHFALSPDATLGRIAGPGTNGEHVRLRVRVVDGDGVPVPDALIEVYQADATGAYGPLNSRGSFSGFGRLATNADGTCVFETIRPGRVPDGQGGLQAPHLAACVFARGLLRQLYTRIYFAGDAGLSEDRVLALVPSERRATLMATADPHESATWTFDVRLQGERETVFFDL